MQMRVLNAGDLGRVRDFYDRMGYHGDVRASDLVLAAEDGGELIGAVRLCEEEGERVLRGMYIRRDHQRSGLGTEMLNRLVAFLGARRCWCVPFDHLTGFYGKAGFRTADRMEAPEFLRIRLATYRERGMKVTLMVREGAAPRKNRERIREGES